MKEFKSTTFVVACSETREIETKYIIRYFALLWIIETILGRVLQTKSKKYIFKPYTPWSFTFPLQSSITGCNFIEITESDITQ